MTGESALDTFYWIHPRVVTSIKSADSVAIRGAGAPLELSLALFQVLMAFAERKTARQAFQMFEADVDLDQFGRIVRDFLDHGLLRRDSPGEDGPGLREILPRGIFSDAARVDQIGRWMRQGRIILVPDALPADLAEEVHRDLCRSTSWSAAEGGHDFFHYRTSVIEHLEDRSPALTECNRLFKSPATRRFMTELSGQDCSGETGAAAAWYRPGEYALPHDDSTGNSPRSVAYIWYLTKDWRPEWGGALFWCPTGQYISPKFNMLAIFNVAPSNLHSICPVAPAATGKRLTINGFWHRAERDSGSRPVVPKSFLSPPAYGQPAPEDPALAPVIVL